MNAFATAMNMVFGDANMAVDALWFAGGTGPGVAERLNPVGEGIHLVAPLISWN